MLMLVLIVLLRRLFRILQLSLDSSTSWQLVICHFTLIFRMSEGRWLTTEGYLRFQGLEASSSVDLAGLGARSLSNIAEKQLQVIDFWIVIEK